MRLLYGRDNGYWVHVETITTQRYCRRTIRCRIGEISSYGSGSAFSIAAASHWKTHFHLVYILACKIKRNRIINKPGRGSTCKRGYRVSAKTDRECVRPENGGKWFFTASVCAIRESRVLIEIGERSRNPAAHFPWKVSHWKGRTRTRINEKITSRIGRNSRRIGKSDE